MQLYIFDKNVKTMKHYNIKTYSFALGDHANMWVWENNSIKAKLEFKDFKTAFAFMTNVAEKAELMQHHPYWQNSYNKVLISLFTHDKGGVTDLDITIAKYISEIYRSYIS